MREKLSKTIRLAGALTIALLLLISVKGMISTGGAPADLELATSPTGAAVAPGEVQEAVLKMENYGYVFEPATFKKGVPVKVTADMDSLYGCMRSIRIPAFGVSKLLSEGDNTFEFTPDQAGTFQITCSMNMGRGTFQVSENDGSVPETQLEALPPSQGSCGATQGGGGCGCGGAQL